MILLKKACIYKHFIGLSFIRDKGVDYDLFEIKFLLVEFYLILRKRWSQDNTIKKY